MATHSHAQLGDGPDLVLLHGVGLGASTFGRLAELLATDHRVLVIDRDVSVAGRPLAEQVDEIATTLSGAGCRSPQVVGVSGGATLGLLLGILHVEAVGSLVLHEPLVGQRAGALAARFAAAAARAAADEGGALDVVRAVMGAATWAALDEVDRARVAAGATRARSEIPLFASFAPSDDELRKLRRLPLLTTVGANSGPERHVAAGVLVELAGAAVATVQGSANAVQLDAPEAFAQIVRAWTPTAASVGS